MLETNIKNYGPAVRSKPLIYGHIEPLDFFYESRSFLKTHFLQKRRKPQV